MTFRSFWVDQPPDFKKSILKIVYLPCMPSLSSVLDHLFLDGLGHEAPLDSVLKIFMKKHFASEIALHESCKQRGKLRFLMRICRWLSYLITESEHFWILDYNVYRNEPGWKRIMASYCTRVFQKSHLQERCTIWIKLMVWILKNRYLNTTFHSISTSET